jgi:hypothetical protein
VSNDTRKKIRYFEVAGPMDKDEATEAAEKVSAWKSGKCSHCKDEFLYPAKCLHSNDLCPDCADD